MNAIMCHKWKTIILSIKEENDMFPSDQKVAGSIAGSVIGFFPGRKLFSGMYGV